MEEVSNIILGLSGKKDRFRLRFGWWTFYLSIKPLTARQVIEIGGEMGKMKTINVEDDMTDAFWGNADNLYHVARSIAIATGTKQRRIVTNAVLDLKLEDIQTLWETVKSQSDMERFFFIMISTKGMNLKGKKEEQ